MASIPAWLVHPPSPAGIRLGQASTFPQFPAGGRTTLLIWIGDRASGDGGITRGMTHAWLLVVGVVIEGVAIVLFFAPDLLRGVGSLAAWLSPRLRLLDTGFAICF